MVPGTYRTVLHTGLLWNQLLEHYRETLWLCAYMAEAAVFNGTTLISRLPSAHPVGIILLAHGCRQAPTVWFSKSAGCASCAPRPEELCIAVNALRNRFALVAAGNLAGSKGCWGADDLPVVRRALFSWRRQHKVESVPLFAIGPSSGGWFAGQTGRNWIDMRAVSMQVMVPTVEDVSLPLPSTLQSYPPLEIILMSRDTAKLRERDALLAANWPGRGDLRVHVASPKPIGPTYFSDTIVGMLPNVSAAVHAALVKAGHVDAQSGKVRKHPSRGSWRDTVLNALGHRHSMLPQGSLQLAMDAVFAELDTAYGYHASTCEAVNKTLDFFRRTLPSASAGASWRRPPRMGTDPHFSQNG